ncbi:MAG: NAD(P)-binding domain-containing protein [Planctomycetota bacterium]|nr:NAD(P)-binding domain-containing protein [Planctomycetota bacterium]
MFNPLSRYTHWLHTRWPAGTVEKMPLVNEDGSTNVSGLYVVGDLTGIPLLKFSSDTGAKAVRTILAEPSFPGRAQADEVLDLVIVGAGVSGMAAMAEAKQSNLKVEILEAASPFSTIVNFPAGKPIFTYPTDLTPTGDLQFAESSNIKEGLLDDLNEFMHRHGIEPRIAHVKHIVKKGKIFEIELDGETSLKAHRVIVGIGRSGNYRKLGIEGEDREFVYSRLHDPKDFCGQNIVIVGGGDSALETAIVLTSCGSHVTLSYRKAEFSRPKPDNLEKIDELVKHADANVSIEHPTDDFTTTSVDSYIPDRPMDDECPGCGAKLRGKPADGQCPECGSEFHRSLGNLRLMMASKPKAIRETDIVITNDQGEDETIAADAVFMMIGREAPLDFFRRSGVHIRGEWRPWTYISCLLFFAFCFFLYHWKSDAGFGLQGWFKVQHYFPFNIAKPSHPANFFGTVLLSMQKPSFYYTLAYTSCIVIFGIKRIRRRKTPYVTAQTWTLMSIQAIPLFILPFFLLPWMGHNGWFDAGFGKTLADGLFPVADLKWENHGREYWRSVGFILAWPLLPWNFFTNQPMTWWLIIGCIQTFVIIPLMVWKWGKGAYCGWICSCGALAETMGDTHRHKMPHGPFWNRLNMVGQFFLVIVALLFIARIISWVATPGSDIHQITSSIFMIGFYGKDTSWNDLSFPMNLLNYVWFVDLLWAGVFGVAFYFWFSGRVWCRFACPLAALMNIYARFSRFRIIADKKNCISCNVCTSVCHQGIDVMNFANKGLPMEDPECVRCSACVQSCPTGVLQFGEINRKTGEVLRTDQLAASPVQMAELTVLGKAI